MVKMIMEFIANPSYHKLTEGGISYCAPTHPSRILQHKFFQQKPGMLDEGGFVGNSLILHSNSSNDAIFLILRTANTGEQRR